MNKINLTEKLPHILNDNKSGSNRILEKIITVIIEYLETTKSGRKETEQEISVFVNRLLNKFQNFVVLWHFAKELKSKALEIQNDEEFNIRLKKFLLDFQQKWDLAFKEIAEQAIKKINFNNNDTI